MKILKKGLSVFLAILTVLTLLVPTVSAGYDIDIENGSKISYKYFAGVWFGGAANAGRVTVHYIDANKDGYCNPSEMIFCLQRGTGSGSSVSSNWGGIGEIEESDFWEGLSRGQKDLVFKVLSCGYPNNTGTYGVSGAEPYEMFYATQVLLWEYLTGSRGTSDFTVYNNTGLRDGPKVHASHQFEYAFVYDGSSNLSNGITMTRSNGQFIDAYNYYCKLLDAVSKFRDTPVRSGNTYDVAPAGSGTFYTYTKPGTYKITNSMFSEFTFRSSETNTVAISQSGDTLTLNIKQACNTATITGTKKTSASNYSSPAVMLQSGAGKQILMWGVDGLDDPTTYTMRVQAEPAQGGIGVLKENTNGNPVKDVVFGVYSDAACKNKVTQITTNEMGWGQYGYGYPGRWDGDGIANGTKLYVKEISGPSNVVLDTTVREITVEQGKWYLLGKSCTTTVHYNMFNGGQGNNNNFRVDSVIDGSNANGIKYAIYSTEADAKNKTNAVKTGTTSTVNGENGKGPEWKLDAGYYHLRVLEDQSGSNIVIPGTIIPFQIVENTFTGVTLRFSNGRAGFVNETRGGIAVKKTDINGNALPGAKFGVYSSRANASNDSNRVSTITIGDNGIGTYGGYQLSDFTLAPGTTYYVKEVSAPAGYICDDTIRTVTVESGRVAFVGSTGTGQQAKINYINNGSYADSKVTVSVQAQDANGKPISGVYFDFYNSDNVFLKRVATDTYGNADYNGSAGTRYYVKLSSGKSTKGIKYDNVKYRLQAYTGTLTRLYLKPDTAVVNKATGAVSISKHKDGVAGLQIVQDFQFNVYSDSACKNLVTTITTNSSGIAYYGCSGAGKTDYSLEEGKTYYFKEAATQADYIKGIVIDTKTVYSAVVVGGKVTAAYNSNGKSPVDLETSMGGIGVMKVSAEGLPMEGVKFAVYESYKDAERKTDALATATTDENGVVIFGGYNYETFEYEAGTNYYVRELDTYAGYVLDETIYPVIIQDNAITYVGNYNETFVEYSSESKAVNKNYGRLVLYAQRTSSGTQINYGNYKGLKVAIYTSVNNIAKDNRLTTLETNSKGYAYYNADRLKASTLAPGKYYAKIVGSSGTYPEEFTDNSTAIPFTVYPNTTTSITMSNFSYVKNYTDNYGAIGVLKTDEDGNTLSGVGFDLVIPSLPIPGIGTSSPAFTFRGSTTFGVYSDSACTKEVARIKTGLLNPMATYGESYDERTGATTYTLKAGTKYYIKEIYALSGYAVSEKIYPVTVKAGQTTFATTDKTYIRYETPATVQNKECGGFVIKPYGKNSDETIASTITIRQFEFDENGDFKYEDSNNNGQYDEGDELSFKIVDTYTVKAGGSAYCYGAGKTSLAEATYKSSSEYELFIITIENKDENGEKVSRNYSAYALPNTTTVIAVDNYSGVVNYNYGGIRICKTDSWDNPIKDCEFEVSTSPTFDTVIDTIVTDAYGYAEIRYTGKDGKYQPYDETKGGPIYYFRESKCPDEYMLLDEVFAGIIGTYEGEFTEKQTHKGAIDIEVPAFDIGWSYIDVVNLKLGSLKIVKECVWGAEGFEFTIKGLDEENKHVERTGITVADKNDPTKATILFEGLAPGWYSITEVTKDGYFPVSIDNVYVEEGVFTEETVIEVENNPVSGTLTIQKEVSEGPVEGWKFRVEGVFKNGDTYDKVFVTDATCKIRIEGLYEGDFTITELEEQDIIGYYPETTSVQKVKLDWTTESYRNYKTVKFKNILNEFKIYKVDMYDYPMSGVKFGVYLTPEDAEADVNRVTTLVTGEDGWAYFKGFDKKEYFIKEVETYPGYQMSAEIVYIDNTDGQYRNRGEGVADWVCVNYIITTTPTGVDNIGHPVAWLVAPMVLGTGAIVYGVVKNRKKKKKS